MDAEYELSAMRVKLRVLEAEHDVEELWVSDEYQELERRVAELEKQVERDGDPAEEIQAEAPEAGFQK